MHMRVAKKATKHHLSVAKIATQALLPIRITSIQNVLVLGNFQKRLRKRELPQPSAGVTPVPLSALTELATLLGSKPSVRRLQSKQLPDSFTESSVGEFFYAACSAGYLPLAPRCNSQQSADMNRRDPDPPPPYYAIQTLEREGVDVHLCLSDKWQTGHMSRGTGQRRICVRTAQGGVVVLPPKMKPVAWCPVHPANWPELPNPLRDDLVWDAPYSALGSIGDSAELRCALIAPYTAARNFPIHQGPPWKRTSVIAATKSACADFLPRSKSEQRLLIRMRLSVPPLSWREIGEMLRASRTRPRAPATARRWSNF